MRLLAIGSLVFLTACSTLPQSKEKPKPSEVAPTLVIPESSFKRTPPPPEPTEKVRELETDPLRKDT